MIGEALEAYLQLKARQRSPTELARGRRLKAAISCAGAENPEWARSMRVQARPIVSSLLTKRVTITPTTKGKWILTGEGTLAGLFTRNVEESVFPVKSQD